MNAFVDPELCIGCTQCAGLCPAVFRMEGVLAVAEPGPIPPEEVPQAVTAAQSCPVSAIQMYIRDRCCPAAWRCCWWTQ